MESASCHSCSSFHPVVPFSINILPYHDAEDTLAGTPEKSQSQSKTAAPIPPAPAPTPAPIPPLDALLPGVYRDELVRPPQLSIPSVASPAFLSAELGLGRLDGFTHHWFWLLGAPALPHPLHDCARHGRSICVTERMDSHLGLGDGAGRDTKHDHLFVKPLPRFLLDTRFWQHVLACEWRPHDASLASISRFGERRERRQTSSMTTTAASPITRTSLPTLPSLPSTVPSSASSSAASSSTTCERHHLWACALGFLYSYVALVASESDFRLAHEHGLLPHEVTWPAWSHLARQVATCPDVTARRFHQRFLYGELQLHRLREISQLRRGGLLPVMVGRLDRFARFFQSNVRWLASLVAYLAIVLSALQTGLASETLATNASFQSFASGFSVFSLVAPLSILVAFSLYFGLSLLYHISVHLVTSHIFVGSNNPLILEGVEAFQNWETKSEV